MNRLIYRLLRFNNRMKQWLNYRLTPSGLSLLVGLFVFGLVGLDIKRSISYQIFVFLLVVLSISVVMSCLTRSRNRFSVRRKLPRFGTVGTPLKYQVVIENKKNQPQNELTLIESLTEPFPNFRTFQKLLKQSKSRSDWLKRLSKRRWAIAPKQNLPTLLPQSSTQIGAELLPLRRGLLKLQKLTVACPEPLGLVNRCVSFSLPQSVLILPKRYELPTITLPGSRRHQSQGLAMAASLGDSQEFRALREYRPGDSPRKIHWKSWAKLGKPVIKEEQTEYSVRHALVLDTFQPEDYSDVMEEAVAIATSLACTVQTQESLLDMLFVSGEAHCFTVGRGLGQTEHLLELLASVQPCQDEAFESLLPVVRSRLSLLSGCICVFLNWDSARLSLVEQLQQAGVPVLVLIVAPETGLKEQPDRSCLKDKQSSLHVLNVNNIQAELLAI